MEPMTTYTESRDGVEYTVKVYPAVKGKPTPAKNLPRFRSTGGAIDLTMIRAQKVA